MSKTQAELLGLTPDQEKAVAQLKRAFTACAKVGVYLWDNYGTVAAVNGKHIRCIDTGGNNDEPLDPANIVGFTPKCWHGSNADDPLFVTRR